MTWVYRFLAVALLLVAATNAVVASRQLREPNGDLARRLTSMFPASASPQLVGRENSVFRIRVSDCARPLAIAVAPPSFTPRAVLLDLGSPGDHTYYAYLDWFAQQPDRRAVVWRRLKQPLLAAIGMSRYGRLKQMLVIAEPAGCNIAASMNWQRYWRSN